MKIIPVIMAGGSGTRFWPLSRRSNPKQVLNIDGTDTMIGQAVSRFERITEENDIFILTVEQQHKALRKALAANSSVQYIFEPVQRGTSACILLAALQLRKKYGDCTMVISPSDHYIALQDEFTKVIQEGCKNANEAGKIITIGITPTFPSTGYGYINCDSNTKFGDAYKVNEFVEKPDFNRARAFLREGNYLWNSGIFIFNASVIIENFKRFLPRIYDRLTVWEEKIGTPEEKEVLKSIYPTVPNISVDYGIMERSDDIYVIPADVGWNDVGSWDSLGRIFPPDENGNIVRAKNMSIDTKNSVLFSEKSLVATIGVKDMIIVDCPDALLVCPKSEAQRVKELVEKLRIKNMEEYL